MQVELFLVILQCGRGLGVREDVTLDEIVAGWALVEALFEIVCCALALEFEGFGLEGAVSLLAGRCTSGVKRNTRCSSRIEQNVPVLEVLRFRAVLQVLLQAVPALVAADGRDGRVVDGVFGGWCGGHGVLCLV